MKSYTKSEQKHAKYTVFTQNFNPRYLLEKKTYFKKSVKFGILRWTSFLMIPLTFLYGEYIDRIVPPPPPPPTSGVGTKNERKHHDFA